MRVLHVNGFHERVGGAEVYLHSLLRLLRDAGHEVALFAGSAEQEIDEPALRVVRRAEYDARALFDEPPLREAFRSYLATFRPELLHLHNLTALPVALLLSPTSTGLSVSGGRARPRSSRTCPPGGCRNAVERGFPAAPRGGDSGPVPSPSGAHWRGAPRSPKMVGRRVRWGRDRS